MKFMTYILIIEQTLFVVTNCQLFWQQLFDTLSYKNFNKPPPRRDAAISYDRDRNRVILFGGCQTKFLNDYYPVVFDDTWEFNLETKLWRELTLSKERPSARYGMVYSHNKFGLYISSGRGAYNVFFNDIWVYDFSTDMWKKMEQSGYRTPAARYGAVGGLYPSYETSDNRMNNFYMLHGKNLDEMYGDLYRYSFTDLRNLNGIWGEAFFDRVGPYGADYPHARIGHSGTLIATDTLLMYGGCLSSTFTGGPCPSSDSWLFTRNRWEKVDSSCISPRIHSSMASLVSDGQRYSAVLFSGLEKERTVFKTDEEFDNEVAIYDNMYKKWIRKRVQGFYFPEKRNGHVMCTGRYNSDYGVYVFGGYGHASDSNLADLWFLRANITAAFNAPTIHECASSFTSIHLHSILMFLGWAVLINIGIVLARYTENKKWLKVHRVLQATALVLITAGMFLGYWSAHGIPHLAHALIGSAAYLLALSQPMTAYLRYRSKKTDYYIDEDEKSRANTKEKQLKNSFWRKSHQYIGHFANALALVNISMGLFYAVYHWMWYIIWFTYLLFILTGYLFAEIKGRYFTKSKKRSNSADTTVDTNAMSLKETTSTPIKKRLKDDFTTFTSDDDTAQISDRSTDRQQQQRYTMNKPFKQSPTTPPPPYNSRNNDTMKSNKSILLNKNNASPTASTLPKQSKLVEYSQATTSTLKKQPSIPQSYSKQQLIENLTTDDEQYYDDQYGRQQQQVKTLQYSPKFKTSYENYKY